MKCENSHYFDQSSHYTCLKVVIRTESSHYCNNSITNVTKVVCTPVHGRGIVFASSVQSGFFPPKRATVDRNRSRTDPNIAGTELDHLGPVYFGPWDRFKPIQTGFFSVKFIVPI
jgi:hypothetical protein